MDAYVLTEINPDSYTHLTLPTNFLVYIMAVYVFFKYKTSLGNDHG